MFQLAALLGLVPEEVLALCQFFAGRLGAEDGLQRVGVVARVPRLGGDGHGRGREVLHLLQLEVHLLGQHGQFGHVLLTAAWMGADEVGDDLLAQPLLAVNAVEEAFELAKELERGLSHQVEHAVAGVLRGHLQASADVTGDELAGVFFG